ncbi:STAS domain-containing protein [Streptomyces sp. CA-179760]|uniref:STAS domain-containing protein n=1 Tax=Streptomyces sp. CA-179760 TaxID=3240054 RepID=UPI003D8F8D1F
MPSDEAVMPTPMNNTGGKPSPQQVAGHVPQEPAVRQYEWHGAWVVAAHGAYDMHSITPLAKALQTAAGTYSKVILDASGVTFADSTLLNLLILTHREGNLRVVAPSPQLQRLCEITGVDSILQVRETVDDAAAS